MKLNSSRSHSNTLAGLNLTFAVVYLNTETEHCTSCGEEMEFSIAHTELQPVIMAVCPGIISSQCRRSPQPWKVEFEWAVRNLKKHNFRYNAYVLALGLLLLHLSNLDGEEWECFRHKARSPEDVLCAIERASQNIEPEAHSNLDPRTSNGWRDFYRSMFWLAVISGSLMLLHGVLLAILRLRKKNSEKEGSYGALILPRFEIFLLILALPCICEASAAVIRGGASSGITLGSILLATVLLLLLSLFLFLSIGITFGKLLQYKEIHQEGLKFHWYQDIIRVTLSPGSLPSFYSESWSSKTPTIVLLCITSFQLFFMVLKRPFIKKKVQLVEIISVSSEVGIFATCFLLLELEISTHDEIRVMILLFLIAFIAQMVNEWSSSSGNITDKPWLKQLRAMAKASFSREESRFPTDPSTSHGGFWSLEEELELFHDFICRFQGETDEFVQRFREHFCFQMKQKAFKKWELICKVIISGYQSTGRIGPYLTTTFQKI
ncbi:hypothetical protein Vadar_018300 [Vaccinium darrowii]|uniref:Uncharacterized protein n=1 Tax=Vaccinium darrowii TaxID=229202 RepID=A0ACB7XRQ3_9ERIC|nr:hypothetical protein Vadar_018300 [Vaccinium darrowii]